MAKGISMKTLIITTGVEPLLKKTLDSLWKAGKYIGDIIAIEFETPNDKYSNKFKALLAMHNGKVYSTSKSYKYYSLSRYKVTQDIITELKDQYDIFMLMDGDDIEIFEDINPLFNMATEKICCIEEHVEVFTDNGEMTIGSINHQWQGYCNVDVEHTEWWNNIRNMFMLNAGLVLGPPKLMLHMLDFVNYQIRMNPVTNVEQVWFNAYARYYYPQNVKLVGIEWNYLSWFRNWEITGNGCIAKVGHYKKINILHHAGITMMKNKPWDDNIPNRRII